MKRYIIAAIFGLGVALASGFGVRPVLAGDDTVIGKAGSVSVTVGELRRRLLLLSPEATQAQRNEILQNSDKVKEAVNGILVNKLLAAEARNKKLDDSQQGRDLLNFMREDTLARLMLEDAAPTSSIPVPTDAEIRDLYNLNKASLKVGKQYRVARIFVAAPDDLSDNQKKEAKRKIDECHADLKGAKAEQFARAARICSEDTTTRDKGGEIGFLVEDQIAIPQYKETLVKMKVGEISAPFFASQGWHILRLMETKPAGTRTLEEVKETLAQGIKQQKLQTARNTYIEKLVQDNKIEIKDDGLAAAAAAAK